MTETPEENELVVMTVNVGSFETCDHNGNCVELIDRIARQGCDVICIQEEPESMQPMKLPGYKMTAKCQGERVRGSFASNAIYARDEVPSNGEGRNIDITRGCGVQRCAAVADIAGVVIATVQLCGGARDDPYLGTLGDVKGNEIEFLLNAVRPDVIAGDFGVFPGAGAADLMFAVSHHDMLLKRGYDFVKAAGPTDKFGGTPDWFYYNPDKMRPTSARIVPLLEFTDHNAVVTTFAVRQKPKNQASEAEVSLESALREAAETGNYEKLSESLSALRTRGVQETREQIAALRDMLYTAAENGRLRLLRWLRDEFSDVVGTLYTWRLFAVAALNDRGDTAEYLKDHVLQPTADELRELLGRIEESGNEAAARYVRSWYKM